MTFREFGQQWHYETFMEGAFGLEEDIYAYLDDPETTLVDNPFRNELIDLILPSKYENICDF